MSLANLKPHHLTAVATTLFLFACGGGSGTPVETVADPVVTATPTPAPTPTATPTPAPTPPTPTPTACTAAPIGSTGYSLVFKGCDASNVATYYDKTECVRDNATGLIWEGKTISGLRDLTSNFTNFTSTSLNQKVTISGSYEPPTQAEIDASTNSVGYTRAVNASNLCGSNAWRLPIKNELLGLVTVPSTPNSPTIDLTWFPNTDVNDYWASSLSIVLLNPDTYTDTVSFRQGSPTYSYRGYYYGLRLVRQ